MQLFNDEYSELFSDMSEKFKNQTLFFKLKNNDKSLEIKQEDNIEFYYFLQNKNSHNKFNNIVKFYTDYVQYYDGFNDDILILLFDEIFHEYLEKIFKNGYLEKKDFEKLKYSKSFNFLALKRNLFLDFSEDKDKIYITLEYLFGFLKTDPGENIQDQNLFVYSELSIIAQIFLESDYENKIVIKTLKLFFEKILGQKLTISNLFYLVIYNKIYNFNPKKIIEKEEFLAEKLKYIVNSGFIRRKIKSSYEIVNDEIYKDGDFIILFLTNTVYLVNFGYGKELIIGIDFFKKYIDSGIGELKVVENIGNLEAIKNDISEKLLFNSKVKFILDFDETKNINKKNIKYSKKELKDHKSISFVKKGLEYTIEKLFSGCDDNSFNYIFLLPLTKASKRFINSNFNYTDAFDLDNKTIKDFVSFLEKNQNNFIEINSFIDNFFENNIEFYKTFSGLKNRYYYAIGRKIPEGELEFLIGERELIKRFFIYLAELGFLELYGKTIKKDVFYLSGDGFGYSYGLTRSYKEIDFFEIEYVRYVKQDLKIDIPKDNHISGNDIYLSLASRENLIKNFAKFTKLEKLENYAIVNVSRDTLIKAKNEFSLTEEKIKKYFDDAKLEISKTLDILVSGTLNQKEDLKILPVGIPVIFENKGIFNELKKLKMFNKYILYENEVLNLIIFDEKFRNLEKLLSSRKIVYKKVN